MLKKSAFIIFFTFLLSIKDMKAETYSYHRHGRAVCTIHELCQQTKIMKKMQNKLEKLINSTQSSAFENLSNLDKVLEKMNTSILEIASNLTKQQEKLMKGNSRLDAAQLSKKLRQMKSNLSSLTTSFSSKIDSIENKHLKMKGKLEVEQAQMILIEQRANSLTAAVLQLSGIGGSNADLLSETRASVAKDSNQSSVNGLLQKLGRTAARIGETEDAMVVLRKSISSSDGNLGDLETSMPIIAQKIEYQGALAEQQKQLLAQFDGKMGAWNDTLRALKDQGTDMELDIKLNDAAIELLGQSLATQEEQMKTMDDNPRQ